MYCYVIRGIVTGRYKVGVTRNIKKRMANYGVHCSETIELVFIGLADSIEDAMKWERSVLKTHSSNRIHGEWLDGTAQVLADSIAGIARHPDSMPPPIPKENRLKVLLRRRSQNGKPYSTIEVTVQPPIERYTPGNPPFHLIPKSKLPALNGTLIGADPITPLPYDYADSSRLPKIFHTPRFGLTFDVLKAEREGVLPESIRTWTDAYDWAYENPHILRTYIPLQYKGRASRKKKRLMI